MRRRHFLFSSVIPLFSTTGTRLCAATRFRDAPAPPCPDIYASLVRANDDQVPRQLARQEQGTSHPGFGGLSDGNGIYTAGGAAGFIKTLAASFSAPESRYAGAKELINRMEQAVRFLRAIQHPDGTIDLHTTNFHSPPDTAFVVEPLAVSVAVLQRNKSSELSKVMELLRSFLLAAGDALTVGGVHTPNHRWVVCAALARLNSLYPHPKYIDRMEEWLGEGVDIDADGQYAEHSTSIYSPLTDNAFLTMARLLNRPKLLDPVRRNLAMTLYYLHADGEVATEGSRRQDQYTMGSALGYYLPYRYLSVREQNGQFAAAARMLESNACERMGSNLIYFLEEPLLRSDLPASEPLPQDFARVFHDSGLARIRRGQVSASILASNPTFFSLHKGKAVLEGLRLASAFFGKGQFQGSALDMEGRRYTLRQSLSGPYYQPLPACLRRPDGDWSRMDNGGRAKSEVQNLISRVTIVEDHGRFSIEIEMEGCDHVPVAVEFGFRRGGRLSGATPVEGVAEAFLLKEGTGTYEFEGQVIVFGPGQADHRYVQLRGALPRLDGLNVYLTGFTPFRKRLLIS